MDLDKFNQWVTLVANIGVVAGLAFVGFEVRQNTLAIEREVSISFADNIHGSLSDSDYLAPIVTKLMEKDGVPPVLAKLATTYNFAPIEAQRWWRHLMQIWLRHQADWIYRGRIPNDCEHEIFLMRFEDNQILLETSSSLFDSEFVACIQEGIK